MINQVHVVEDVFELCVHVEVQDRSYETVRKKHYEYQMYLCSLEVMINLSLVLYSELSFSDAPRGRMNLQSLCNLWAESSPTLLLFISLI